MPLEGWGGVPGLYAAGCDGTMPDHSNITHPLLRLGRLPLGPGLRDLAPGSAGSDLVVTATVAVPDSSVSQAYAWDVAWADAVREAGQRGGDPDTAQALERGAGAASAGGAQVAVAAHAEPTPASRRVRAAIAGHLPETIGPVTAIAGGRAADGLDSHLSAGISAAIDDITSAAIVAVGDLVASRAEGPNPAAVRGIKAVAEQLAEQQVAVLLVAADLAQDAAVGSSYGIGSPPTEFLVDDSDIGGEVPLEDGLVWAALHQDAIVVRLPDSTGPPAGEPAAALLRRGSAR